MQAGGGRAKKACLLRTQSLSVCWRVSADNNYKCLLTSLSAAREQWQVSTFTHSIECCTSPLVEPGWLIPAACKVSSLLSFFFTLSFLFPGHLFFHRYVFEKEENPNLPRALSSETSWYETLKKKEKKNGLIWNFSLDAQMIDRPDR